MTTGNWMGLTSDSRLDNLTNSQLNVLLGETEGEPKYTAGQMKSKTKADLIAELEAHIAAMEAARPEPKVKGKRGAAPKVSKNKDVAASKQTNIIKAVVAGKMTTVEAQTRYDADPVLQEYCPLDKWSKLIADAVDGKRPGAVRVRHTVTIEID